MSYRSKLITHIGVPAGLLGVAAATRLAVQEGIPFYPDSYQFMLLARQLTASLPVQASLGMGGDAWGIPFHRVGYGFVAGMGTVAAMYFVAGLAFRSWWAGFLAGAVTAVSSLCDLGTGPVLVVVDEPVRSKLGSLAESANAGLARLFSVETTAPYLEGRSVRSETYPAVVYVAR